jgi:serine protease Do
MKHRKTIFGFLGASALSAGAFLGWAASTPDWQIDSTPLSKDERAGATFAPVIRQVAPSVVNIYSSKVSRSAPSDANLYQNPLAPFFGIPNDQIPQQRLQQSLGSGVIVSKDGFILTNHHVIEGAEKILVALHENETPHEARLVGTDPQTDIAVIKIEMKNAPAITLADSDLVEVGDVALAIGNPFGIGQTVTMGIVSAKGRRGMGIVDYEDFIQTDASINPGNSGGALVDAKGRLIGINQSILSRSGGNQGVGFSVPINLAKHVMGSLVANGRVERGHLGITIQPVTEELAEAFGLKDKSGALVGEVSTGSPADEAGIKPGDVIVELDDKKVSDSAELRLKVSKMPPGSATTATVMRDRQQMKIKVRVGSLTAAKNSPQSGALRLTPLAGLQLQDLDARLRQRLGIPSNLPGPVIAGIEPASPAARTGLRSGDVIFEINRRPVQSAHEVFDLAQASAGRRLLLRIWSQGIVRYLVLE